MKGKITIEFDYKLRGSKADVDAMLKVIQDMVLTPPEVLDDEGDISGGVESLIYDRSVEHMSNAGNINVTPCRITCTTPRMTGFVE